MPKDATPPNFAKKTFTKNHKTMKFTSFLPRKPPLYSSRLDVKQVSIQCLQSCCHKRPLRMSPDIHLITACDRFLPGLTSTTRVWKVWGNSSTNSCVWWHCYLLSLSAAARVWWASVWHQSSRLYIFSESVHSGGERQLGGGHWSQQGQSQTP